MQRITVADALVGRDRESRELGAALAALARGRGDCILIAGEAGIGKTRLVDDAVAAAEALVLRGAATQEATPPYGPIVAALRAALEALPSLPAAIGPLGRFLALALPELGPPPDGAEAAALAEAFRAAFRAAARLGPLVLWLDDLHWADHASLDLLPQLAALGDQAPFLLLGAYRSDEIGRGHPLRRLRTDLRRARRLREITLEPLDPEATALLAARTLGAAPAPALAALLYDRTQGAPFFVEELAAALASGDRLRRTAAGLDLAPGAPVPAPDTVRDAVLLRVEALPEAARRALDVAAVAGGEFDLDLLAGLTGGEEGIDLALGGLLVERAPGRAAFRHALAREALYSQIPWTRRRALHRAVAERLAASRAPAALVAEHRLAARDTDAARRDFLQAGRDSAAVHAYRDAASSLRRALDLWGDGADEAERMAALDHLGEYALLAGDQPEALRAWREVVDGSERPADAPRRARAWRRLATVLEVQGQADAAVAARQAAAVAFDDAGERAEAATERIAAAGRLQAAGRLTPALLIATVATAGAAEAGHDETLARALALEGFVRAKLDQPAAGLAMARAALTLALDLGLTGIVPELYQRLAIASEHAAEYAVAREVLHAALALCERSGESAMARFCVACMGVVHWFTGDWQEGIELWRTVRSAPDATPTARLIAVTLLGLTHALQGDPRRARLLLTEAAPAARRQGFFNCEVDALWGLALVEELDGATASAASRYRALLGRWQETEERHYIVPALLWAGAFFAAAGYEADVRAVAQALTAVAAGSGNPEALAALALALAECALLDGAPRRAAEHASVAVERAARLDVPLIRATIALRAGVIFATVPEADGGGPEAAARALGECLDLARRLGARPLAERAAALASLLGTAPAGVGRAPARTERGGLSEREVEVVRLVAAGLSNREIAGRLVLSTRTVDMHLRNILTRLDCRSRAEATRRAAELGLLV